MITNQENIDKNIAEAKYLFLTLKKEATLNNKPDQINSNI